MGVGTRTQECTRRMPPLPLLSQLILVYPWPSIEDTACQLDQNMRILESNTKWGGGGHLYMAGPY